MSEADKVVRVAGGFADGSRQYLQSFSEEKCWDYAAELLQLSELRAESSPEPAGIV